MNDVHPLDRDDDEAPIERPRRPKRRFLDLTVGMRLIMIAVAGAALITWAARINREHRDPTAAEVTMNLDAAREGNAMTRMQAYAFLGSTSLEESDRVLPVLMAAIEEDEDARGRWTAAENLWQYLERLAPVDPTTGMPGLAVRRLSDFWAEQCRRQVDPKWFSGAEPYDNGRPDLRLFRLMDQFGPATFPVESRGLCIGLVMCHMEIDRRRRNGYPWSDWQARVNEFTPKDAEERGRLSTWAVDTATSPTTRPGQRLVGVHALAALAAGTRRDAQPAALDALLTCAVDRDARICMAARELLRQCVRADRQVAKALAGRWRDDLDPARAVVLLRAVVPWADEVEVYEVAFRALGSDRKELVEAAIDVVCAMATLPAEMTPRLKAAVHQLDERTRARVAQHLWERAERAGAVGP